MAGRRFEVISDVTDVEAIAVGRRHPRARSPSQALRSRALAQDEGSRYDPSGGRSSSASFTGTRATVSAGRKSSASATCQRASHGEGVTVWSGRWEGAAVKSIEAVVTYTRKDGTVTRPLPVTSTLRMRGDLIKDYRIFMDVSPLFAQQA